MIVPNTQLTSLLSVYGDSKTTKGFFDVSGIVFNINVQIHHYANFYDLMRILVSFHVAINLDIFVIQMIIFFFIFWWNCVFFCLPRILWFKGNNSILLPILHTNVPYIING